MEGSRQSRSGPAGNCRRGLSTEELVRLGNCLERLQDVPTEHRHVWFRTLSEPSALVLEGVWRAILDTHPRESGDLPDFLEPVNIALGLEDQTPLKLSPGDAVGPYTLIEKIGEGGMGVVWRARRQDVIRNRVVALKVPAALGTSDATRERLSRECEILAALSHPGIARLYDAGVSSDGVPFLALEYVEGQTLGDHVRSVNPDLDERLALFAAILDALEHAHRRNIVHLDLKPSNVVVTPQGRPMLLDFGIARILAGDDGLTGVHHVAMQVTPAFAAPELLAGAVPGPAADIYSIGVLLYSSIVGCHPCWRSDGIGAEEPVSNGSAPPDPPSVAVMKVPGSSLADRRLLSRRIGRRLDAVVMRAMDPDPRERHASASELRNDLLACMSGRSAQTLGLASGAAAGNGRRWLPVTTAVSVAILLAGLLAGAAWVPPASGARGESQEQLLDLALDLVVDGLVLSLQERGVPIEGQIGKVRETVEGVSLRYAKAGSERLTLALNLYGRVAKKLQRSGRRALAMQVHELRVGLARDRRALAAIPSMLASAVLDSAVACLTADLERLRCDALKSEALQEAERASLRPAQRATLEGRIALASALFDAYDNPEAASAQAGRAAELFLSANDASHLPTLRLVQGIIEGSRRQWQASLIWLQEADEEMDKADPLYPLLQSSLCETSHRLGDLRAAERICTAALLAERNESPGSGALIGYQLGVIRLNSGDYEAATKMLLETIRRFEQAGVDAGIENNHALHEILVHVMLARGSLAQAAVYAAKLPSGFSDPPNAWQCSFANLRERLAEQMGLTGDGPARARFTGYAVIPRSCDDMMPLTLVARLIDQGSWNKALREIERREADDFFESKEIERSGANLTIQALTLLVAKATALLESGRTKEAMPLVMRLQSRIQTSSDPKTYKIFSMDLAALLGRIHLAEGHRTSAILWLEDALRAANTLLEPESPKRLAILCHLAMARAKNEDRAAALALALEADRIVSLNGGRLSKTLLSLYDRMRGATPKSRSPTASREAAS